MVKLAELIKAQSIKGHEFLDSSVYVNGGKTDSRQVLEGDIYFALKGQNSDGHDFIGQSSEKGMAAAVVDASYKNTQKYPVIYSENVERTLGEFAKIWRTFHNALIIGITGTNGKTTTKEMLARILSRKFRVISTFKNYNNQIGVPLTLLSIKDDTEIAIVEIGTNHFGEIEYLSDISDPDIGIITNIGEAHLEYLINKDGVYKEKKNLFEHLQRKGGQIFVNLDDEYLKNWTRGNVVTFGMNEKAAVKFDDAKINDKGFPSFTFMGIEGGLIVPGILNLKNALAAAAIAFELKIEPSGIIAALRSFSPSDKRYEMIEFNNSEILLDCYNANPTSMENFLRDISITGQDFVVILGDMLELGRTSDESHIRIVDLASSLNFSELLLTGNEMKKAFESKNYNGSVTHYDDFEALKNRFIEISKKGQRIAVKGSRGMKLEKLLD